MMPTRVIDWDAIHGRLDAVALSISGAQGLGSEQTYRILEARARELARVPAKPDDIERLEVLVFSLARETYAFETCHVAEVCQLKQLTPVPSMPSFVAGVMNLRGLILAIVDLRTLFELPAGGITELSQVIVLRGGGGELGVLADSIEGVRLVDALALQEGLPTITGVREKFLKGVVGQMLAVIDAARLLNDSIEGESLWER